ncbi:MAG: hypothetical protein ACXV5G_12085 [Halobacteriota archaeon]
MAPVFCGESFSQVPPFLRERYLENYEHLFNGKWKLSSPNATQWQQHITAIANGAQATEGKIYTNRYFTNSYDKIYATAMRISIKLCSCSVDAVLSYNRTGSRGRSWSLSLTL